MNRLWFPGRRLPGLDREDGFGLVEAVMAMGIIFVSLLALVYTTTIGFATSRWPGSGRPVTASPTASWRRSTL